MLEVKNAFYVLLFVCLFLSFIEGFFLLVFKPCWKKTFLLRAPLGCPSLGCSRREGKRHNLGGFVVFNDVCHAATIILRILRGFHSPAFRTPFFMLQPAQLDSPEKKKGKTIKNNKNKNLKQPSSFPPLHPKTKLQQARLLFGSQITPLSTGTRESHFICLNFRTKLFSTGNFHSCCRFTPEGARSLARLCCLKWCWKLTLWALSLNVVLTFPF